MADEIPSYAPADYRRMVTGSRRLTSTFRFETDSAVFDTRALVDLERVTAYLVEKRLNGSAVKVLGFTDSKGKLDRNLELARERANLVREAFEQRGISGVEVAAFGPAMPVASNDTADGRQRNRRVEIWIPR
jgi:phosphate transport system substrate-binding protein